MKDVRFQRQPGFVNAACSLRDAAQLELMGISMSREIISQMESGHHNIRISVLLAFKQVYEVDSFDDFFVQQEKGGDR